VIFDFGNHSVWVNDVYPDFVTLHLGVVFAGLEADAITSSSLTPQNDLFAVWQDSFNIDLTN